MSCHIPPSEGRITKHIEFVHKITAREKQSNALEHTKAIVKDFVDSSFQARR